MIRQLPAAATAAVLALAAPAAQAAPAMAHPQPKWPDLTNTSSAALFGTRFQFPSLSKTVFSNRQAEMTQLYAVSAPWAATNVRLLFPNFYTLNNGGVGVNPETCPGNPITISFATVFSADLARAYPVTFGGQPSVTIADCGFVWSDPIAGLTEAANTGYYYRTERTVTATNLHSPAVYRPCIGNLQGLDEWYSYSAISQAASYATSGDVTLDPHTSLCNSQFYGPAAAVGTGWDGTPVYLIAGDSISWGNSDYDYSGSALQGFIQRGLDDSATSTRFAALNWGAPGTRARTQSTIVAGQFQLRLQALKALPNRPFNRVITNHANNEFSDSPDLGTLEGYVTEFGQFWRAECNTCLLYAVTLPPRAQTANSNSKWTDQADQAPASLDVYPGGLRWQFNTWLKSVPAPWDGVIDTGATMQDATNLDHFKTPTWTGTLASSSAIGDTSVSVNGSGAPAAGDILCLEPSSSNVDCLQIVKVTGPGPYAVDFAYNTLAKAHTAGGTVLLAYTPDGLHPGSTLNKAAAAAIVTAKIAGTLH